MNPITLKTLGLIAGVLAVVSIFAPESMPEGTAQSPEAKAETKHAEPKAEAKPGACLVDERAIEDLKNQKLAIQKQEAELKKREEELTAREAVVKEDLAKLEELGKKLEGKRAEADAKQQEQLARLVDSLEKVSPKATAKLLGEVNETLAVEAMSRMSTEKLAKVLNVMEPAVSSRLSELLAQGHATPRTSAKGDAKP
jgi:flagellar motility protein MotE (MotC chaperone)